MSPNAYVVNDLVVLKAGLTRTATGERTCRIVGVLPAADRGEHQYRVRFDNENFERRIVASDIDTSATKTPMAKGETSSAEPGEPWVKLSRIRVAK